MIDNPQVAEPTPNPPAATPPAPRRFAKAVVGTGLAAGLALGVGAIAQAQTEPPATDPPSATEPAPEATPAPGPGVKPAPGPGQKEFRDGGHRGPKFGMGGPGIHGEFVVPDRTGGYRTIATQHGTVSAVSATSITVKSEDGFSRTYVVDDNTVVHAGDSGIGDVESGDTVQVAAVVTGDTAKATDIGDATAMGKRRG